MLGNRLLLVAGAPCLCSPFTPSEMLEMRQRVGTVPAPGVGVLTLQWGDLCMGNRTLSLVRQVTDLAEEPGKWRR